MPTAANRRLFRGGGATKPSKTIKAHERKRGTLRAKKFAAEGMAGTIGQCCKCKYNSTRCEALRKSDGKRCDYCAYRGSKWCGKHQDPESRGGAKPKKPTKAAKPTKAVSTSGSSSSSGSSRSSNSSKTSASSRAASSKGKGAVVLDDDPDDYFFFDDGDSAASSARSLASAGLGRTTWKPNASGKGGYTVFTEGEVKKAKPPTKAVTAFLRAQKKRSDAARAKERRAKEDAKKKVIADSKGLVRARARTSRNSMSSRADRRRDRANPAKKKPDTRSKKKK